MVKVVVAVTVAVGRSYTFRSGDDAASAAAAAFVVTTLVSTQGLSCGEGLVADGAHMGPTTAVVGGRDGAGSDGGRGGGGGGLVFASSGVFSVAGLVSTEGLVRGEGLVANRTLVHKLRYRYRRHLWCCRTGRLVALYGGGGVNVSGSCAAAATSEHDEAESEVLFLGGWVIKPSTLRTLALGPWLKAVEAGSVLEVERRGGCGRRVESFQSHLFHRLLLI